MLVLTIVSIYLAARPEPAVGWFIRFYPPDRRDRVREVLSKVRSGLLLWLKGRLAGTWPSSASSRRSLSTLWASPRRSFWAKLATEALHIPVSSAVDEAFTAAWHAATVSPLMSKPSATL